ncbi:MAG: hypothetical protein CMJ31_03195, partial [Phycisphaerae bacterium]|nr:hypothetical protein [Phycisphaerae bacterium]
MQHADHHDDLIDNTPEDLRQTALLIEDSAARFEAELSDDRLASMASATAPVAGGRPIPLSRWMSGAAGRVAIAVGVAAVAALALVVVAPFAESFDDPAPRPAITLTSAEIEADLEALT